MSVFMKCFDKLLWQFVGVDIWVLGSKLSQIPLQQVSQNKKLKRKKKKKGKEHLTHALRASHTWWLKAYSLMLNRGRSENFHNLNFLHIFVALLL